MARTRRIKKNSDAHYHLMSRTNDRRFLFEKGEVKTELVSALRRAALGDRFHSGGVSAHQADNVGWSTHGWRLAAAARRICRRNVAETHQK